MLRLQMFVMLQFSYAGFSGYLFVLIILSLRGWYFFNHNTRHGIPTSIAITEAITLTLAYPEAHTYVTFRNLVTVAFNMAVTVGIDGG